MKRVLLDTKIAENGVVALVQTTLTDESPVFDILIQNTKSKTVVELNCITYNVAASLFKSIQSDHVNVNII